MGQSTAPSFTLNGVVQRGDPACLYPGVAKDPGDQGVTARDANAGSVEEQFLLSNGQLDLFRRSMTVTVDQALLAIEHFERTVRPTPLSIGRGIGVVAESVSVFGNPETA